MGAFSFDYVDPNRNVYFAFVKAKGFAKNE
jgi:hypothetical protein